MKPMYQSGVAYTEARLLHEGLVVPDVPQLPQSHFARSVWMRKRNARFVLR